FGKRHPIFCLCLGAFSLTWPHPFKPSTLLLKPLKQHTANKCLITTAVMTVIATAGAETTAVSTSVSVALLEFEKSGLVGRISRYTRERDLKDLFSKCGRLRQLEMKRLASVVFSLSSLVFAPVAGAFGGWLHSWVLRALRGGPERKEGGGGGGGGGGGVPCAAASRSHAPRRAQERYSTHDLSGGKTDTYLSVAASSFPPLRILFFLPLYQYI
ncbi:hypothetical protein BC936DRAFT_142469, partial [Jimgerdemannia flammicorona]